MGAIHAIRLAATNFLFVVAVCAILLLEVAGTIIATMELNGNLRAQAAVGVMGLWAVIVTGKIFLAGMKNHILCRDVDFKKLARLCGN